MTRDGCSVDVYLKLPYRSEVELLGAWLAPRCSVLELGCGTGRLTRRLLDRGHAVTAVDNSEDMLRHVPESADKVCCDIEQLELGRTFDVALLASHLINVADDSVRRAQLAACHRHLSPRGALLFQRFDPEWLRADGRRA
jgi:SAM-dependent methyltransferase